jgi:HSP20 family molecular chaperone IbpA
MKEKELTGWMWTEACGLIEQAERLHRQFFRIGVPRGRAPAWEPPADIYESNGELTIYIALPGVAADNVRVLIEEDVLSIVGARLLPRQSETAIVHRLEIPHGRFERRLRLPARTMKVTHSRLDNGCLTLVLRGV